MTGPWQRVDDPAAARLILSPDVLAVLEALMLREWSVSVLAAALGRPLNAVHHRVRRLVSAGLVVETRREARRGRPVCHYRASAQAYFIPYDRTPLRSHEEMVGLGDDLFQQRFDRAVVQAGAALVRDWQDIGVRVYVDGGSVREDVTPSAEAFDNRSLLAPDAPALFAYRDILRLSPDDAKAMQHELDTLVTRYAGRGGGGRYLLRLDLAPDVEG